MNSRMTRNDARAGVFFIVAAVASFAGLALYQPLLGEAGAYVTDPARGDASVLGGAFLESLLVIAAVGTAVTLYPLVRPHGEGLAVACVAGRVMEATVIAVGIASVLGVVALRRDPAGDAGAMRAAAAAWWACTTRRSCWAPAWRSA